MSLGMRVRGKILNGATDEEQEMDVNHWYVDNIQNNMIILMEIDGSYAEIGADKVCVEFEGEFC